MTYKIKTLDETFHNPFEEEKKLKSKNKKPIHISDKGGLLKPRREVFNINRVVYSKRPNGEYTILSKTQFAKGEIIEICPIIFVGHEAKGIDRLKDFIFEIEKTGKTGGMWGLVLGYGSLYKHSEEPNVEYAYNRANRQMYFKSAKIIQAHEELTINYGKDYWDERATFGTVASSDETTIELPAVEESSIQPSGDDITGKMNTKAATSPSSIEPGRIRNNPAASGHSPIQGGYG